MEKKCRYGSGKVIGRVKDRVNICGKAFISTFTSEICIMVLPPLTGLPSPPQTLSSTVQQYGRDTVTLTVQWQPPQYDGGAPVNYTITVSPGVGTFTTCGTSIMVAGVPYNVIHTVSIVATNCNGGSSVAMVTILAIGMLHLYV